MLELLKEGKSLAQLSSEHGIHANVLRDWKAIALKHLASLFERRDDAVVQAAQHQQQLEELYAEIGKLTTQVNWLKKTSPPAGGIPPSEKRASLPPAMLPLQ